MSSKGQIVWGYHDEEMVKFWNMYRNHEVGTWENKRVVEMLESFDLWVNELRARSHYILPELTEEALKSIGAMKAIVKATGETVEIISLTDKDEIWYFPGSVVLLENSVPASLTEALAAVLKLCATVRRYAAPAKDDDYCSRSELLRAVAEAEKTAHGMK